MCCVCCQGAVESWLSEQPIDIQTRHRHTANTQTLHSHTHAPQTHKYNTNAQRHTHQINIDMHSQIWFFISIQGVCHWKARRYIWCYHPDDTFHCSCSSIIPEVVSLTTSSMLPVANHDTPFLYFDKSDTIFRT